MIIKFILSTIPALIFAAFFLIPAWLVLIIYDNKIKGKKSPLNIKLLRRPGESLQEKISNINDHIILNLFLLPIIPIVSYSAILTNYLATPNNISTYLISIYCLIILGSTIYISISIYKLLNKKNLLKLGLECELAVGQDLQNLIACGFKVYNDLQAQEFNIDHIAIGPTGVFLIETKGRSKSTKREKNSWKVEFDGEKLIFPGWIESAPVKQVARQSAWLKKWIYKSTGERINVTPVLAIPGWFINRKTKSNILIYNGKNPLFMAKGNTVLTKKQIQSISYQIENRCRNIPAESYKKIHNKSHQAP